MQYLEKDLRDRLTRLAYQMSRPFCYHCYQSAPTGRCPKCGSDDLMREVPGVGCEYGAEWVVSHILLTHIGEADIEADFEQSIADLYPETTKVGWIEVDTVALLKEYKTDWRCALADHVSYLLGDDRTIEVSGRYFWRDQVETYLDSNLTDQESA